jgi:hypothetical protein
VTAKLDRSRAFSRDWPALGKAAGTAAVSWLARHWKTLGLALVALVVGGYGTLLVIVLAMLVWSDFLLAPFRGFTFTDPPDFIFVGLIAVTLTALAARHRKRPYPAWWVKVASVSAVVLSLVTPLVPLAVLYLLSDRGYELLGHWPREMSDDPKYIGLHDSVYQGLRDFYVDASAFAGWGLITWGALVWHLRKSISAKRILWLIGIFLLAWLAFLDEPGNRYNWWLD